MGFEPVDQISAAFQRRRPVARGRADKDDPRARFQRSHAVNDPEAQERPSGHRFIGDPLRRIAEDHLRILRLFRFHARFGRGTPDPAAPAPGPTTRASRAGRPAAAPVGGHTGVVAADRPPTGWRDPVVRSFAWLGGVALLGVVLAGAALERGRRTDRRARG